MNMKRPNILYLPVVIVLMTMATGCLKNDIPYARIQANVLEIAAQGQSQAAKIDSILRVVDLYFPEETDISRVTIDSMTLTPGAEVVGDSLTGPVNLSGEYTFTLRLYQDWQWTLVAHQTIERYFSIEGQIGTSTIDLPGRRVIAYIGEHADISRVLVEKIKLGPQGWAMTPDIEGHIVDFTHPVEVTVDYYGTPQTWTIYIDRTESKVTTTAADGWTNVAWVYGEGEAGADCGFQYRIAGSTLWTDVPDEWVTVEGGAFKACIRHLSVMTEYEVRAVSGSDTGQILKFTTGYNMQLPNEDFDSWWLDKKVWCPWPQGGEQYWDTGNTGAATLGQSNVVPTDETPTGTGQAAKLETRFVGIAGIGKLAAGSIFVGKYVRTDGTNGVLSFGRECPMRPTRVRGYLKYKTAPINYAQDEFKNLIGQPDTCIVWCALIDQEQPFEIRTNPKNRQLFDPDGSYVVAYGKIEFGQDVPEYIPFEFELDYKSTSRVPRYILLTAAASKYGDYFTGGAGAVLLLDDIELLYDY